MAPSPYFFTISIGPVDMNKYARFDEIPSTTLKDIKETKRYGRTDGRTDFRRNRCILVCLKSWTLNIDFNEIYSVDTQVDCLMCRKLPTKYPCVLQN